jgi:anti-sigma-K factor RskA
MSELVNGADTPAAWAAEYVLGTLEWDERSRATDLLSADPAFAAKVKLWERRLGELHQLVEPVEPDPSIWERIKARLPDVQRQPQPAQPQSTYPEPAEEEAPARPEFAEQTAQPQLEAPGGASEEAPSRPEFAEQTAQPRLEERDDASDRLDAAVAAISEAAPSAVEEAPAVPTRAAERAADLTASPADAIAAESNGDVSPSAPPPLVPAIGPRSVERHERLLRRRLNLWRACAALLMLLALAVAALVGMWRFAPDRVPPSLRPTALLRLVGVNIAPPPAPAPSPPARRSLPPGAQFDE